MKITALAGGIGAGKFLRGLGLAAPGSGRTVIVNTGDDIEVFGLHISPDLDSVCYWLAGLMDRERGWGRGSETFHAMDELRAIGGSDAWFNLGDRDLATHLYRTALLRGGSPLSAVTAELVRNRFGLDEIVLPMTDDPVTTRIDVVDDDGRSLDLHFQDYWVRRHAACEVKTVRLDGVERSRPAPGAIAALEDADVIVLCPSNPVVSLWPVLSVPGVRETVAGRSSAVVGVSPIVGGAPVAGMADRLMPAMGLEVSALGAARSYADLLGGWVIDEADRALAAPIELELGIPVAITDSLMTDDAKAEALASTALSLLT